MTVSLLERAQQALEGRYEPERELGSGGSATVFLARDTKHDRPVAVKVLRPELTAEVGAERFLREIRIVASLNHPHILPLLDSGDADGLLFYVSPYAAAGSLRRRLGDGPLPVDEALRIAGQVAAALGHAHRRGVLHRDVKPENILFSDGMALVADFGLARALDRDAGQTVTRTGLPLGTPGYMSPEQALGGADVDSRTDVYGLACVVYELLVGWPPRLWCTEESIRLGRLMDAPAEDRRRLDRLPGRIEQALVRGLAMRPADRYAEPEVFAAALVAAQEPRARLDEEAVRTVLRRAAELEAAEPEESGTLSIGAVERIAAEVDIPPEYIRAAAQELALEERDVPVAGARSAGGVPVAVPDPRGRPVPRTRAALRVGGLEDRALEAYDSKQRRVTLERDIPVRLAVMHSEAAGRIQDVLGLRGTATARGDALTWAADAPGDRDDERRIAVRLSPTDAGTRLVLEEHVELPMTRIMVPVGGAAAGAFLGLAIAAGVFPLAPLAVLLMVACGILGAIFGADRAYWLEVQARYPELEDAVDVLADQLEELGEPVEDVADGDR